MGTQSPQGTPTIEDNTISGNAATGSYNGVPSGWGGGIFIYGSAKIIQNLVTGNSAAAGGGVALGGGETSVLVNNTVLNNSSGMGSGIYVFENQSQIINNLVIAVSGQTALYCDPAYTTSPPMVQSTDAFSSGGNGFDGICAGMAGTNGNISVDPLFLDSASNFHLQFGSPAIDAGNNSAPSLPSMDFNGDPRIVNRTVDMGAYEFLPTTDSVSPASLTFASQQVGTTSPTQTVTVTNTGYRSLLLALSVDPNFGETDNCGSPVASGASCSINVTFTPTTTGTLNGNLTLRSNAAGSPQTVALSGSAYGSVVSLSPSSLSFGGQLVGTTSPAQTVTLTNAGNLQLNISGIAASGDFAQTNNCGSTVATGGNCSISMTFTPSTTGTQTATLTIMDDGANSPQTVSLTGTGVGPASLSPNSLTFSSQIVGTSSGTRAITLINSSGVTLSISSITISGTNSGDFAQINTCGTSPAINANCYIKVNFTPTGAGTRTAALVVVDNASNSPQAANLTGTGIVVTPATPTLVQVQNNIDTSGAAFASFSVPITTTAGNLLVAFCRAGRTATDSFTVTDSAGQTWAQTSTGYLNESDTGPRIGMFYVANSAAVTSVTVRYSTAGGVIKPGIIVMEISGAATSGVADGSVKHASLASVPTSTSGSLTTGNANDLLIFATDTSGNETGWTAGAGYTIPNNKLLVGASGSNVRMAMQYTVVSSTQTGTTTSMTYANSNWNGNIFAAFKGGSWSNPVTVSALSFNPTSVMGGDSSTGTITLSGAAPSGGAAVSLLSNNAAVQVPASVTVAAGATSATFTATTSTVTSQVIATVTATYNNTSQSATLTLNPPSLPTVSALSLSPATVTGGSSSTGTITLSGAAPTGGAAVSLLSNNAAVQVPASVTVAAGATSATFTATTSTVTSQVIATITATYNSTSQSASLTVNPAGNPVVTLSTASLNFGKLKVGTTSSPQNVTLTNTGTGSLTISGITFTGTNSGDFAQTNTCGTSVAAGGNCAISVTFKPTAKGPRTATLNVGDNAGGSPQQVSLKGQGS